jgi:hypothetical protein
MYACAQEYPLMFSDYVENDSNAITKHAIENRLTYVPLDPLKQGT